MKEDILLAFKIWVTILPIAFINGIIRVAFLNLYFGERLGHILSTFLLVVAVVLVVCFFNGKIENRTNKDLMIIGILLVFFTIVFEFSLGFSTGKTWQFMLEDYNLLKGRIWLLVLLTEFLSPLILKSIRKS